MKTWSEMTLEEKMQQNQRDREEIRRNYAEAEKYSKRAARHSIMAMAIAFAGIVIRFLIRISM